MFYKALKTNFSLNRLNKSSEVEVKNGNLKIISGCVEKIIIGNIYKYIGLIKFNYR